MCDGDAFGEEVVCTLTVCRNERRYMYRHMVDILCVNWVGTALCTIAILVGVFE